MVKLFWKWLTLFAYRRWSDTESNRRKPVGVPGNRDPENPCHLYSPRKRIWNEWNDCAGDGHYLCLKCCHFKPEEKEED